MHKQILLFFKNHFSGRKFQKLKKSGFFNTCKFKINQHKAFKQLKVYEPNFDKKNLSMQIGSNLLEMPEAQKNDDKVQFLKTFTIPKAYELYENQQQSFEKFLNLVSVKIKEIQLFEAQNFNWAQIQLEAILSNKQYEKKEIIIEKNLDQNTEWKICYINLQ